MRKITSYRDSHTEEGKGAVYDEHYRTEAWRKILWNQEQLVLSSFLDAYFKNRTVDLLDFACGTGRIPSFLENRVETSTAVDVSKTMLDEAKRKLKRTRIILADLTKNNVLEGRKFNLITAFRFFLNAEPGLRTEALQMLVSLLSKDGYIVFNNHKNRTSPLVWPKYFYHNRIRKRKVQFMSYSEIKELAREAGIEIVRIYPVGLLSLPRVKPPEKLSRNIDNMAMKFRLSGIFSESPVVVCRRCQEIRNNRYIRR
jgi:predicted TPR repeat methyltransferase